MFKKIITVSVLSISLFSLSGCNTISGFGSDLKAGGEAITKSADKVSNDISADKE